MATEQTKTSGPVARLKKEAGGLADALTEKATSAVREKVEGATGRLADYVEGQGGPGLMAAVTGAKGLAEGKSPMRSMLGATFAGAKEKVFGLFRKGGKGGGRQKLKVINIVESIDVGAPVRVVYNQWTQFRDFPTYTKKVENVEQVEDEKLNWKAQIFWSHRTWEASIIEQHPDERIIWRSKGQKGHVDGAVTFHELTPNLTRIVVVMEYHPQGMFERTGNLWRAQGRRARLELKHFERQVMSHTMLNPDDVEGWRGVIEDGEVVKDHETAMGEEERERGESGDAEKAPARRRAGSGTRQASRGQDRPARGTSRQSAPRTRTARGDGKASGRGRAAAGANNGDGGGSASRQRGDAEEGAGRTAGRGNGRRRGAA